MITYFKLKSFPHFSETFITSNILYAKEKEYDIKIVVDRFLGFENSSQKELLESHKIKDNLITSLTFSRNILKKTIQFLSVLSNYRLLKFYIKYCFYKKTINLKLLNDLHQFKDFKKGLIHVHFNTALDPIPDLTAIGYISPKCIITFHGYDAFLNTQKVFYEKYFSFYKSYVAAVTVNSNYLKQRVIKLGVKPELITIIPMGIDIQKFNSKPKRIQINKKIKLLTIGRLIQLKGHEYAIKAVKMLLDLNYEIEYTIVGFGNNFDYLKQLVRDYKIESYIKFEGQLSQNEIIKYLNLSDIFIMPSTYDNKTGRREAFGLVSIEAQAMGLPVIGFNSGGFPDTIVDNKTGFAVKDRNVDEICKKIIFLANNPLKYMAFSSDAISHAKKFSLDDTFQKYLDLYDVFNKTLS